MEKNEDIQLYIKNLQENEINQFYNLPNQKLKRHIIQFKQLIAYFNFKLLLTPLENKKIYNNKNELDLYAEFVIVDKSCFYLFTLVNKIPKNLLSLIKSYQIRIYQEKYILIIDDKRCILKFRENEKNQKFELLFILKHEKINQEAFCKNI